MKQLRTNFVAIGLALCLQATAFSQQFSSGSTGADGPLNITTADTTLDLPPDGIFNFTTITFSGGALRFKRNAANTPVYLLATGDVVLGGGFIIVDAQGQLGGPGGFDGGFGAYQGFPPGHGMGPGGGPVNSEGISYGVFAIAAGNNNNLYGNSLVSPLIGGSGAGAFGSTPGGGGGGAILIASSTRIVLNGTRILANGSEVTSSIDRNRPMGSGGAIRLVAPIVGGSGELRATSRDERAHGRIRIDSLDRFAHRSIFFGGIGTRGSQMFVFPQNNPRLQIVNAAGTEIDEDITAPVTVTLPVGSSTEQTVRVQARGFTGDIPIRVKITPENGTAATFDSVIPAASGNPPFVDVPVTLVIDTVCHVHAWTR